MAAEAQQRGPPAMVMPVDASEQQLDSLQGQRRTSVLPFLSTELLAQQAAHRKQHLAEKHGERPESQTHEVPPASGDSSRSTRLAPAQTHSSTVLHNLPPRSNNTRTNILDYLAWLNLVTRLTSAQQLTAQTRKAELESDAFATEKKPNIASSTFSADGSGASVAPTLDEDEIMELLKGLPGALTGQLSQSSDGTPAGSVARATGLERLVTSMSGSDTPILQLHQEENSNLTGFKRHRYNLAILANQIFGEASSHLPSALATSASHYSQSRPKDPQKTVSLHPTVSLVNLPRVILPIVGISTIPQSILGIAGSSGVPMALLQLKFGGGPDEQPSDSGDQPLPLSDFAPADATLPRNPHHDYRIRHTASVHERAKQIYDKAALKSPGVQPWCSRHRVQGCSLCTDGASQSQKSLRGRKSRDAPVVPGDGLGYFKDDFLLQSGRRRPLARSLADFLTLAADVFKLMALGSEDACERYDGTPVEFTPLSTFYELVVDFITQAVLEGYTIHGWTGKEALEVLFSVGTGTWEERKWADIPSSWTTPVSSMPPSAMPSRATSPSPEAESSRSGSSRASSISSDASSEDTVTMEDIENIQDPRFHLIKAATELFRTRTPAQAEFEREMRDRMHEFLDVPEETTLEGHLRDLGAKYPLSVFEERMLSFFTAVETLLGKPTLVKNTLKAKNKPSAASPVITTSTLDFAPLEHFASRFSWADLERAAGAGPSSIGKRSATPPAAEGKRRKI